MTFSYAWSYRCLSLTPPFLATNPPSPSFALSLSFSLASWVLSRGSSCVMTTLPRQSIEKKGATVKAEKTTSLKSCWTTDNCWKELLWGSLAAKCEAVGVSAALHSQQHGKKACLLLKQPWPRGLVILDHLHQMICAHNPRVHHQIGSEAKFLFTGNDPAFSLNCHLVCSWLKVLEWQ